MGLRDVAFQIPTHSACMSTKAQHVKANALTSTPVNPGETSYLDSNSDALVLNHLDKWDAIIRVLVECFVKEDHSTDAVIDAVISGEEHLSVEAAVLLVVLYSYLVQTLPHAAC